MANASSSSSSDSSVICVGRFPPRFFDLPPNADFQHFDLLNACEYDPSRTWEEEEEASDDLYRILIADLAMDDSRENRNRYLVPGRTIPRGVMSTPEQSSSGPTSNSSSQAEEDSEPAEGQEIEVINLSGDSQEEGEAGEQPEVVILDDDEAEQPAPKRKKQ